MCRCEPSLRAPTYLDRPHDMDCTACRVALRATSASHGTASLGRCRCRPCRLAARVLAGDSEGQARKRPSSTSRSELECSGASTALTRHATRLFHVFISLELRPMGNAGQAFQAAWCNACQSFAESRRETPGTETATLKGSLNTRLLQNGCRHGALRRLRRPSRGRRNISTAVLVVSLRHVLLSCVPTCALGHSPRPVQGGCGGALCVIANCCYGR